MEKTVELRTLITPAKLVRCGKDDYPVLSMTMHNGLVFQDEKFKKVIASKDTSEYKVVYRNQLVISFPIDEGVLATQRITDAGIVSPAYGIWDIDQSQVLPEFLEYALRCNRAIQYYKAKLRGSTARRRSLPTPTLLAFMIPLPSIQEQEVILNKIHKAKTILEQREIQIKKLDELIKVLLVEMFGDMFVNPKGWDKYQLGEVCDVRDGTHDSPKYYKEGYPLVTSKNVAGGLIDLTNCSLICEEDYQKIIKRSKVDYGDIIMPMIGTVGNPVIVNVEPNFAIKNVALIKFRDNSRVLNSFVKAILESEYFDRAVISKVRGGMQKFVALGDIRKLEICVPPLEIQSDFERLIQHIEKTKAVIQKSLVEAQLLFNSLMQQYFG